MFNSKVLHRRIASLLVETEQLTLPDQIIHMSPADRSEALITSWDLRARWKRLLDDIDRKTSFDNYDGSHWTEVQIAVAQLMESIRRFDWLQMELLAQSRHSVFDCTTAVRNAEENRLTRTNPEPDI